MASTLVSQARQPLKRQKARALGRIQPARPTARFVAARPVGQRPMDTRIAIGAPRERQPSTATSPWRSAKPELAAVLTAPLDASRTRHYGAYVQHGQKVGPQLEAASRYSHLGRHTTVRNPAHLARLVQQASAQADQARLPHIPNGRLAYNQWRRDWNAALDRDIELLGQLGALWQAMGLTDREIASQKMKLGDLLDVLRSGQYSAEELGPLLKAGYSIKALAAGLRVQLHAHHLGHATDPEALADMSPAQRARRFERLVKYREALPSEPGTVFYRLARQAFQERLVPAQLAALDGTGAAALRWVDQGHWLDEATQRVQAYRAGLPDMNPTVFSAIAGQALDCDLAASHLPAMVKAGVPINARMKPSDALARRLQQARTVESRAMGGGASGSELRLLTLIHADGRQERLVSKRLVMTPVDIPYGHANAGIPFELEDIAQRWDTHLQLQNNRSSTPEEKAALQQALENHLATALARGDREIRFHPNDPFATDERSKTHVVPLTPRSLPNLVGRDLAMRELAALMGQPELVASLQTAVIDGVYCEVAEFDPDMHREVVRHNGDAILRLDTPAARLALAAMSEQDLQQLATSRGFASAHRPYSFEVRFMLADQDKAVGYYNRFDVNHPSIRRRYNEHQVKNFLGNEADDHESNSTVGASWDHDGSFGIHTSTRHHRMPRLVSASTWAALQQPDWTRFDGLILPAEIEALQSRHRAFIESKPLVVQDGEWGSTEVAKAMDVDALRIQLETFDTAAANAATPAEQRKALDQLSNAVLALETPLARHAGAWAVQQRESQASGQPSTPFFDQEGWLREIQASGRQVSA